MLKHLHSQCRDLGSNPGLGTRSQMPQLRGCLPQLRPSTVRKKEKPACTLYVHTYSAHTWKRSYVFCARGNIFLRKQRHAGFILPSLLSMQLPLCRLLDVLTLCLDWLCSSLFCARILITPCVTCLSPFRPCTTADGSAGHGFKPTRLAHFSPLPAVPSA